MAPASVEPMVRVGGARRCVATRRCRRLLRRLRVPHTYRDLDVATCDADRSAGTRRTPVIVVGDQTLERPDGATLVRTLRAQGALVPSDARFRARDHNLGDLDRAARLLVAASSLLGTRRAPAGLRWPVWTGATLLALTAIRGWCPIYDRRNLTSLNGPGDRPADAERSTWLASSAEPLAWSNQ